MVMTKAPAKAKAFTLAPWWKPKEAAANAESMVEKPKTEARAEEPGTEAVVGEPRMEAVVEEPQVSSIVVTREQLLARMPARGVMNDMGQKIMTRPIQVLVSRALPPGFEHIEPPPGLTMSTEEEPTIAQDPTVALTTPEGEPAEDSSEPMPLQDFKVLLRNLPDSICVESMIWVMLEQAALDTDVLGISTRAGGKALITFANLPMACQCMHYFHGCEWGMPDPVTALYVRTVATEKSTKHAFNAEAPEFVPSGILSVDAQVFNPSSMAVDEMKLGRERFDSSASTAVTISDGVSEESEPDDEIPLAVAA